MKREVNEIYLKNFIYQLEFQFKKNAHEKVSVKFLECRIWIHGFRIDE